MFYSNNSFNRNITLKNTKEASKLREVAGEALSLVTMFAVTCTIIALTSLTWIN